MQNVVDSQVLTSPVSTYNTEESPGHTTVPFPALHTMSRWSGWIWSSGKSKPWTTEASVSLIQDGEWMNIAGRRMKVETHAIICSRSRQCLSLGETWVTRPLFQKLSDNVTAYNDRLTLWWQPRVKLNITGRPMMMVLLYSEETKYSERIGARNPLGHPLR